MKIEDAVKEGRNGVIIKVEVSPNSKQVGFGYSEWRKAVEVRIRSPPKEGKANRELLEIFRELFGEAEIISGEKSRSKLVKVGSSREEVVRKLRELVHQ